MEDLALAISSPEFINLEPSDVSPLISECDIKVMYLGANRNHSFISKEVAINMAKTLRGAPIVGYFKEDKGDFDDHGKQVVIEKNQVKFKTLTTPYGFVAPNTEVWFQKFEEIDDRGESVVREYMMTKGLLWTGHFPECKSIIESGKNQSMELVKEKLNGYWSTEVKPGVEFYIINDATFSKLCILGDDVEPCYEGAALFAPKSDFAIANDFKNTLFSMLEELKGGTKMEDNTSVLKDQNLPNVEPKDNPGDIEEKDPAVALSGEFNKKEDDDKKASEEDKEDKAEDDKKEEEDEDEEDKEPSTNHALVIEELNSKVSSLEQELNDLKAQYSLLESEKNELLDFKKDVENKQKEDLINSFYMLSEEDKKEVIENKSDYSYSDIEAKLSVICVRKKVSFDKEDEEKVDNGEKAPYTYNLDGMSEEDSMPAYIKALLAARK